MLMSPAKTAERIENPLRGRPKEPRIRWVQILKEKEALWGVVCPSKKGLSHRCVHCSKKISNCISAIVAAHCIATK